MDNDFLFEGSLYGKLLNKLGLGKQSTKVQLIRVLFFFSICWVPMAVITLIQGSFWTGDPHTSFIANFDTQARFFISLPILILAEKVISPKLLLTLTQFISSGIVTKEDAGTFNEIINKKVAFLRSVKTDIAILVICYVQVAAVILYQKGYTSVLAWQTFSDEGVNRLTAAGFWNAMVSRPLLVFLFYRWMLRIIVWGMILRKISALKLDLYAIHPDQVGGLGFLGYSIRYFSPIAFAISATVAGNMADFILAGQTKIADLRVPAVICLIFIIILFTLPLMSFVGKLLKTREKNIFEIYNYSNGIYRLLRRKVSKGFENVEEKDLGAPYFSTVADMNQVVEGALKMKYLPFTIKDLIPLLVATAIPFLFVTLLEIPLSDLLKKLMSIVT
jgi:hypothetical protein